LLDRLSEKFGEKPLTSVLKSSTGSYPKDQPLSACGAYLQLERDLNGGGRPHQRRMQPEAMKWVPARQTRKPRKKRMRQLTAELQTCSEVLHNRRILQILL